ncbi:ferrous iron transport protein B [Ignavibacteria bacterium]|nr:ferrous iron transporter B [Bacteroidota bacterium]MCZ2132030.1 ferrous iron transporter B [Bacteroidota bacterium]
MPHATRIAFVGTPNCGKTTIFNTLTGLRQKVGNFPGVTVAPAVGRVTGTNTEAIDLPGIYSFAPKSPDEQLTVGVLSGMEQTIPRPDGIAFIIDGTNIEKGLFLFSYFAELGLPSIVVVTMIDEIKACGSTLDDIELEHILGVPVIPVVGNKGSGIEDVRLKLTDIKEFAVPNKLAEPEADIPARYTSVRNIAANVVASPVRDRRTEFLDKIFLHPIAGPTVFLAVMALFFQSIFTWATPLMDGIDSMFSLAQDGINTVVPDGIARSFLAKGIVAGVGSVLVFLPQILILNVFIVILEDCGYLARAAFLVDRAMGLFGLQGRSFIPLLGSFACAIPGIMSARIIPSEKDRMITMLIAPLMTCSARLPVYALLISAFIAPIYIGGFFSLQAMVLAGLYIAATLVGLLIALLLKKTMFRGAQTPFLIEFPPYRKPSLKNIAVSAWGRSREFLINAGTIILTLSVILWVLAEFPRANIPAEMQPLQAAQTQLEYSFAGRIGHTLQPAFAPIGFDWKMTVGVIGSFAAREVFVAVMGQLYAADVSENDVTLREALGANISLASALAVLAFYVFALQCISTIAVLRRETNSWKWPAFAFVYTFVLAYSASFAAYHITLFLGG